MLSFGIRCCFSIITLTFFKVILMAMTLCILQAYTNILGFVLGYLNALNSTCTNYNTS